MTENLLNSGEADMNFNNVHNLTYRMKHGMVVTPDSIVDALETSAAMLSREGVNAAIIMTVQGMLLNAVAKEMEAATLKDQIANGEQYLDDEGEVA